MFTKNNYMREYVLLVLTVLLGLASAQTPDPYEQLSNHWYLKCSKETKSNQAFDKLYGDAIEFKRYLKYAFKFIPDDIKVFCSSERIPLQNKMKMVTNDLKPCLSSNEAYFEDFLYSSFSEFLHFLCHNDGENLNTLFNTNAAECRAKLLGGPDSQIGNCFSRLLKPASSGQPSKKELCGDISMVKTCFSEMLSQQCPSYGAYKKLNEEFFKYVGKPCSGCAFYLNSILLTISLIASYLFSR